MGGIAVAWLGLAACGDTPANNGPELERCVGKCDAIGGEASSLPAAPRAATWDGRVIVTAGTSGCRASVVRPTRIQVQGASVQVPPATFSDGMACPSGLDPAAIAAVAGLDLNPFPSDAVGDPLPLGDHATYEITVFETTGDVLVSRRGRMIVAAARTADAELVSFATDPDATPLVSDAGEPIVGQHPTATADGGLVVFQANLSDASEADALVYIRRTATGWTSPRALTELHTEADLDVDGLRLADRYPLAAAQLRGPSGELLAPGTAYRGAYPWLSQDGSELVHATSIAGNPEREGERHRRGGVAVIGRATAFGLRHIDGPINPTREAMTAQPSVPQFHLSPGGAPGFRAPYPEARNLPAFRDAPTYPLFGARLDGDTPVGTYNELEFDAVHDGEFLVYLAMNEGISTDADFAIDPTTTPDISGRFNTGVLAGGAAFAVEAFGLDESTGFPVRDANDGAFGRAVYFPAMGGVRIAQGPTLEAPTNMVSVALFVQPLAELEGAALVRWPGVLEVGLDPSGRLLASVTTGGSARGPGAVGDPLARDAWTHVAFTYDGRNGNFRSYVGGELVDNQTLGAGNLDAPVGDLVIGPAGDTGDTTVVLALDEVAVSRVPRTAAEIALAATRESPVDTTPLANELFMSLVPLPLGLDPADLLVPATAPITPEAIALGQMLFFDPRLSGNGDRSCATCHDPELAFTDGRALGEAIDGTDLGRNTPTVMNRAMSTAQFWEGRSRRLEAQALSPIQSPREMNLPLDQALAILNGIPEYVELFQAAYNREANTYTVAAAISAFERAMLTGNSPVDRFEAGELDALSESAQRGRALFHGEARCGGCHSGSNYTDEQIHVTGLLDDSDPGRWGITRHIADVGGFKTPSLRNLTITAPFFHDGSVDSIAEVVAMYSDGPILAAHDWDMRPLGLSEAEQADLVAFLEALTDPASTTPMDVALPGL